MNNSTKMIVLAMALLLAGCIGPFSKFNCYMAVVEAYPEGEIFNIPGEKYKFVVKTSDNKIIFVATMGMTMDNLISEEVVLFEQKKAPANQGF
jgi:hypothetical protein